jgi:hypothetical protein
MNTQTRYQCVRPCDKEIQTGSAAGDLKWFLTHTPPSVDEAFKDLLLKNEVEGGWTSLRRRLEASLDKVKMLATYNGVAVYDANNFYGKTKANSLALGTMNGKDPTRLALKNYDPYNTVSMWHDWIRLFSDLIMRVRAKEETVVTEGDEQ